LTLTVTLVPVAKLQQDPDNARIHSETNVQAIMNSLKTFGQRKPLVVWQGFVIAGNGTLLAAQKLGWEQIFVTSVPSEWTHEQARAYSIADNRSSELAEWDDKLLKNQLIDLDSVGIEIDLLGFEPLSPVVDISDIELKPELETCQECGIKFREKDQP